MNYQNDARRENCGRKPGLNVGCGDILGAASMTHDNYS
jgi:hypothetical protein